MAKQFNNSGLLSRNTRRDNDKQPEFRGTATVDGQDYWLAAWVNENDKGKYFKINFTPKEPTGEESQDPASSSEDVPF